MTVTSDRIKSLRLKKNMSQNELATKLGIGRSNMGHIENGRVEPTKESIVLLSEIFGVTTDYLLGRTDTPQFTRKDERDIQRMLDEMINGLSDKNSLAYMKNGGEELDEEAAELLRDSLERTARRAKLLAKEKFTPKKYRKDNKAK